MVDIVYNDNNIIICNKRPGVASQSERSFERDLLSELCTYLREHNDMRTPYIINRLDKPVGGLVLFALDRKTAAALSAMSGSHSIEKNYYAIVKGTMDSEGTYTDYLLKTKDNQSIVVAKDMPNAKKAILEYSSLETKSLEGENYSLVNIRLHTGRHHQIRVQMSAHGHAIYGDLKYNQDFAGKRGVTPQLFAYRLSFNNPYGAERITVEVKPTGKFLMYEYFAE